MHKIEFLLFFSVFCTLLNAKGLNLSNFDDRDEMYRLIQQIRLEQGMQPLLKDGIAEQVSYQYAKVLCLQKNLVHTDTLGRNAIQRYRLQGGSALSTGEILGRGPDLQSILSMWLQSPAHACVLLDPKWTTMGVGLYKQENTYIITVLFTTSISENRAFHWNENNLEVKIKLREGILPEIWLQAGAINTMPAKKDEDKYAFMLPSEGPERCLIINALGQGDILVIPPK